MTTSRRISCFPVGNTGNLYSGITFDFMVIGKDRKMIDSEAHRRTAAAVAKVMFWPSSPGGRIIRNKNTVGWMLLVSETRIS